MGRGRWAMAGAGLALALGLQGCGTPVTLHETGAQAAAPTPVAFARARSELAAIAFTRVGAAIARGKVVGSAYYVPLRCAYTTTPEITWSKARELTRDVEFQDAFFRVFDGAGYNVLNRPDQLFQTAESKVRPAFEIGAQITDLRINLCSELLFPLGIVTDRVSGEASMVVEWQVFSSLDRRIVRTFRTTGRATLDTALGDGDRVLILDAFAAAAERLSHEAPLAALVDGAAQQTASAAAATGRRIDITKINPYTTPIARRMSAILGATVTVLLGNGHGSGFVVSRDGLILTNNHVVADARQVKIQFASGVKIDGDVLRRDPGRDVALVRVAASLDHPLPIRAPLAVQVGEEVTVIGAPLREDLSSTVTRGIVSALRNDPERGRFIQSDATIHPGNSGGPLLDRFGNVIGISVAALVDPASGQGAPGLNLFIPIDEALERLNLHLLAP